MKKTFLLLMGCLIPMVCARAQTALPLTNPDFEDGKTGWTDTKGTSQVTTEAARSGKAGLRVTDEDPKNYIRVISQSVPVKPGKRYQLRFSARQVSGHGVNAILWFLDDDGNLIRSADGIRLLAGPPEDDNTAWREFIITGVAPENAAAAQVHIQSNRIAIAVVDFDDFRLERLD